MPFDHSAETFWPNDTELLASHSSQRLQFSTLTEVNVGNYWQLPV
jgi:hypothetical protein